MTYRDVRWFLDPVGPRIPARVAFLMDGRAISQSELLLDMAASHHLGLLVGEPTAGINGDKNTLTAGGFSVSFTGTRASRSDGSPLHGVGIRPDVAVFRTLKGLVEGRDEVLEAALATLRKGGR